MCSLALFPPPLADGEVTLYESNNELVSGSSPSSYPKQVANFTIQICGGGSSIICHLSTHSPVWQEWDPPSLNFPRESLKSHSRPESSCKTAFLDHRDTLWMRSAGAWCVCLTFCSYFLSCCHYFRPLISVCLSNRRDAGLAGLLDEITNSAEEGKFVLCVILRYSTQRTVVLPNFRFNLR